MKKSNMDIALDEISSGVFVRKPEVGFSAPLALRAEAR